MLRRCIICGILIDSIEVGWVPYFDEGDQQHAPVCRDCAESLLHVDENGEMEVKEEYRGKTKCSSGCSAKPRSRDCPRMKSANTPSPASPTAACKNAA